MKLRKPVIVLAHAFVGWALCAATMGIGLATLPLQTALIIHAIAAPIFFTGVSLFYFRKFHYTTPLQTALIFVALVIAMDFFVVALLLNRSLEMFESRAGDLDPLRLDLCLDLYHWQVRHKKADPENGGP